MNDSNNEGRVKKPQHTQQKKKDKTDGRIRISEDKAATHEKRRVFDFNIDVDVDRKQG